MFFTAVYIYISAKYQALVFPNYVFAEIENKLSRSTKCL